MDEENQWGFRQGRSTVDVTQVIVRMKEDADDYAKRVGRMVGEAKEENDRMVVRLFDFEKAFPRVSKSALWILLERYGLKGRMLETLIDINMEPPLDSESSGNKSCIICKKNNHDEPVLKIYKAKCCKKCCRKKTSAE